VLILSTLVNFVYCVISLKNEKELGFLRIGVPK
jgi:hypothetical protein